MKRNETHVETRIQAYLDGELSPGESRALRDHCSTCEPCRSVLEDLSQVRERLAADRPAEPLGPMWPGVRDRLGARPARRWSFALGTTGAAALGLALGLLFGTIRDARDSAAVEEAQVTLGESALLDAYLSPLSDQEGESP
jgi:anti-sigma factor RsiW